MDSLTCPRSISVIQWLLNAETSSPVSSPPARLSRFFRTLHALLRNPSRAVLQFYPSSDDQVALVTQAARKAGFGGGVVVDFPNSKKARKVFLCLFVGSGGEQQQQVPAGKDGAELDEEDAADARFEKRRQRLRERKGKKRGSIKDRDWILKKKEARRCAWYACRRLTLLVAEIPHEGEGRRPARLEVHGTQTQGCVLRLPLVKVGHTCWLISHIVHILGRV